MRTLSMKLFKKFYNLFLVPVALLWMLTACGTLPDNQLTSTPSRSAPQPPTSRPVLPTPSQTVLAGLTATPTLMLPDDEQALAKAAFPSGDRVLCNWQILGKNEQELYAWVFCQMVAPPHGTTSAPVVIKLNANGHYGQVILYEDEASTLELFPAVVRKRVLDQDFDFNSLNKRMNERLATPSLPPLIITAVSYTHLTLPTNREV